MIEGRRERAEAGDDQAMREFMDFLGEQEPYPDVRAISMSVGRLRRSWVNNCVAIGLASGFVEPLESTALHFIQMAIRSLVEFFPDKAISPELADGYNRTIQALYEEVRDFICMHYAASTRADTPFWRAVRDDAETQKLAGFGRNLQALEDALPIDPKYRNPKLGTLAPIRVVNEVFAAGDASSGVQAAAWPHYTAHQTRQGDCGKSSRTWR